MRLECSCPPEPPIDYGRGWTMDAEGWRCSRCGGSMRAEQQQAVVQSFTEVGLMPPPMQPLTPTAYEAFQRRAAALAWANQAIDRAGVLVDHIEPWDPEKQPILAGGHSYEAKKA